MRSLILRLINLEYTNFVNSLIMTKIETFSQQVANKKPIKRFTNKDFFTNKLILATAIDFYKVYNK